MNFNLKFISNPGLLKLIPPIWLVFQNLHNGPPDPVIKCPDKYIIYKLLNAP